MKVNKILWMVSARGKPVSNILYVRLNTITLIKLLYTDFKLEKVEVQKKLNI